SGKAETAHSDDTGWLGRQDSNLGMAESKSAALPLGYAPPRNRPCGGRTIAAGGRPINVGRAGLHGRRAWTVSVESAHALDSFEWRMSFSENRFPLFRDMR